MVANDIRDAFSTVGFQIKKSDGRAIDPKEVQEDITQGPQLYMFVDEITPEETLMRDTLGRYQSGYCAMVSAAKRDTESLLYFFQFWSVLCSDNGHYLSDVLRKTTLGGLSFLRWRAVRLPQTATKYGNAFITECEIEFAVLKEG